MFVNNADLIARVRMHSWFNLILTEAGTGESGSERVNSKHSIGILISEFAFPICICGLN